MPSVQCTFKAEHTIFRLRKTCIIQNQLLSDPNVELQFNKKQIRKDDGNTTAVSFKECTIKIWPSFNEIIKLIPNLTSLTVKQCNLKKIEKENFRGLFSLKELFITGNKIMCLPWDVFINTPNLEILSLKRNGIKYIDEDLLEPLKSLKYCDLSENININAKYDGTKAVGSLGYAAFRAEIKVRCSIRVGDLQNELEQASMINNRNNPRGSESDSVDSRKQLAQQREIEKLKAQVRYWQNQCTDFTITVDDNDFKVHKSIITATSPLLRQMIEQTPEADNLILKDISVSTFKMIIEYMYEKKLANDGVNIELFAACRKLEMDDLAKLAATIIKKTVKKENAYEILIIANKYENDELRMAAFKEFKKNFPHKKLTDDIAKQPEILKKIMNAKLAMDAAFEDLQLLEKKVTYSESSESDW